MGIVPPNIIHLYQSREDSNGQPKDERPPLQGFGDQLEGSTGEEWHQRGGQRNEALLVLMKKIESEIADRPPCPRVDWQLIGEDQR